ncbi:MAG TPA: selenocysteine-specific translation elongation factor [Desulfuromonadales bacterium]|nr:selenocysteine-specific translation elongation factor [Desulfuromonadales bacterium]
MKHIILGTAGHIDHGKTSLVKALTGIDTDRLKEEKARGITIELGFAHLELPGGLSCGIVDVPGHEKFVRTMVAGAGGIDLAMLVIAADEGIMPQTREHLDILRLLGIGSGVVVLTKCDLVDRDWLELVTEELRDFVVGSFLEGAPIIPVSSRSGSGLDRLRLELAQAAGRITEKRREGAFRLPVDRVFTVAGFGTVVTGTLLSGEVTVGDELEIIPSGLSGRVRGIQAHGVRGDRGYAGQRLAVNLQGIDHDQVRRGDVVVPRDVYRSTRAVDVRLDYLASAPRDLKHRAVVRLHSATYEVPAQVILLDRDVLQPGASVHAQLRLKHDALLLSGDSYILRAFSPQCTIGGGVALDPFPPRRRRRSDEALQLLEACASGDQRQTVYLLVSQSLLSGIGVEDIILRSGIPRKAVEANLSALLGSGELIQMTREPRLFLAKGAVDQLKQVIVAAVSTFLETHPLKAGIGKEELKTRMPKRSDERFFTPLLTILEKDGKLEVDREIVRPAGSSRAAAAQSEGAAEEIARFIAAGGAEPPTIKEIMQQFCCDEKTARDNLSLLMRSSRVVRVSADLFFDAAVLDALRTTLIELLREKVEIIPTDYRERTNLSRKFLIPLLEHFDSEKITIRVGDRRQLRRK